MNKFIKNKLLIILGCLIFYVISLITLIPAHYIEKYIPAKVNGLELRLVGVSGTIWSGHVSNIHIGNIPIFDLNWSLKPLYLLLGKVAASIDIGEKEGLVQGNAVVKYGFGKVAINNLELYAPADLMLANNKLPLGSVFNANMKLKVPNFAQGEIVCNALDGTLDFEKSSLTNSFGVYQLGDMGWKLGCVDGKAKLKLDPTANILKSDLDIKIDKTNLYVTGLVPDSDALVGDLRDALTFLGSKNKKGEFVLNYKLDLGKTK